VACEDHVQRTLEMTSQLLQLANSEHEGCDVDGCLLLDGLVRDCAMKIRQEALRWRDELQGERQRGQWTQ
jgi:hypothetical protein